MFKNLVRSERYLITAVLYLPKNMDTKMVYSYLRALAPQCSMTWISADTVFSVFLSISS